MGAHLEEQARETRWSAPLVERVRGACNACIAAYDAIAAAPFEASLVRASSFAARCRRRVRDALGAVRARRLN